MIFTCIWKAPPSLFNGTIKAAAITSTLLCCDTTKTKWTTKPLAWMYEWALSWNNKNLWFIFIMNTSTIEVCNARDVCFIIHLKNKCIKFDMFHRFYKAMMLCEMFCYASCTDTVSEANNGSSVITLETYYVYSWNWTGSAANTS